MKEILTKENTNIKSILNKILTDDDIQTLLMQLSSIKEIYLYKTKFHGLYHSQKVLLFAYLIGKHMNLTNEEMQIIMDAAVYHDTGRMNENEDTFHGYQSSCVLQLNKNYILNSEIYNDQNLAYIMAICEAHSKPDDDYMNVFQNYFEENSTLDYNKFKKLADILKDADALDRTRFKKTSSAALQKKYLRFEYSKELIELAEKINSYYTVREIEQVYPKFREKYGRKENMENICACFHGIGVDFFKIDKILKNGILSAYALMKKGIKTPRNFFGSNKELWISVVDANMLWQSGSAYKKYIENNISFYCFVPKLKAEEEYSGYSRNQGDVYNKREHLDEKYVFDSILPSQIHSVIVPNKLMKAPIDTLNYLNCATKYEILIKMIEYYCEEIEESGYKNIDTTVVIEILAKFSKKVEEYEALDEMKQKSYISEFLKELDEMKEQLNKEVQKWFKNYYSWLLGKENPIVSDVLEYIFKDHKNIDILRPEDEESETLIVLNPIVIHKKTF